MVESEKKFCWSHSISQEPYIMWFSFMHLWYKWWYLQDFFCILSKFWFYMFSGGSKGQKIVPKRLCSLHLVSNEPYIIWLSFVGHKWNLMISPDFFFQNFDFSVKGQKMVQNEKRFCLLYSISQEPYIIWLSFVVDKCKMIISPGLFFLFFHFFKIFVFWFLSGIKGKKMTQNDKNFCLLRLISQESLFIVHMHKRKYLLIFLNFSFLGPIVG